MAPDGSVIHAWFLQGLHPDGPIVKAPNGDDTKGYYRVKAFVSQQQLDEEDLATLKERLDYQAQRSFYRLRCLFDRLPKQVTA